MKYLTVSECAKKWNMSDRTIRNYCASGKIKDAVLVGKTWQIPEGTPIPTKSKKATLLDRLKEEKDIKLSGGIYHKIQVDLTYNSNHIEGSTLTHDQTRYIFETQTVGTENEVLNVNDIIETNNHFRCIDYIIDNANKQITEKLIKELHFLLKTGTSDARISWFAVGDYKNLPNQVGGNDTTEPENVAKEIKNLLKKYNQIENKTLDDLLDFHYRFECIHPFQDGNGRIGRLLLFKECLKYNIVPFIIDEKLKLYYYRGLQNWTTEPGFLRDTCLMAQDKFKITLKYFKIIY